MDNEVEPVRRKYDSRFGVATLLTAGSVSTVAEFLAAVSLGISDDFVWGLSTGGGFAIAGGFQMWVMCPDWAYWRRWVWLWVILAVFASFLITNLSAP